jgi:predicted KAP-like P-loop ATPase
VVLYEHEKNNVNSLRIINDMPSLDDHLKFNSYSQRLAEIILNSDPWCIVEIFGGLGTGMTILMRMIQNNLLKNDDLLLMWFNAWKYEREESLSIIPLIRTIEIELQNKILKLKENNDTKGNIDSNILRFLGVD